MWLHWQVEIQFTAGRGHWCPLVFVASLTADTQKCHYLMCGDTLWTVKRGHFQTKLLHITDDVQEMSTNTHTWGHIPICLSFNYAKSDQKK